MRPRDRVNYVAKNHLETPLPQLWIPLGMSVYGTRQGDEAGRRQNKITEMSKDENFRCVSTDLYGLPGINYYISRAEYEKPARDRECLLRLEEEEDDTEALRYLPRKTIQPDSTIQQRRRAVLAAFCVEKTRPCGRGEKSRRENYKNDQRRF